MLRPEISNPPSGCAGKITSLPCRPEGFSRFELLQPEISKNLPAAPEAKKSPAQPEVFFIFGLLRSEIQSSFVRPRRKGKKRRSRKRNLRFWLLRPEISFPPGAAGKKQKPPGAAGGKIEISVASNRYLKEISGCAGGFLFRPAQPEFFAIWGFWEQCECSRECWREC